MTDSFISVDGVEIEAITEAPIPWPPIDVGDDGKFELEDGRIVRFTVYAVEHK